MRADKRLAVFCLIVIAIVCAGMKLETYWNCSLKKGGWGGDCWSIPSPFTPPQMP
jgi:hypothetical protein